MSIRYIYQLFILLTIESIFYNIFSTLTPKYIKKIKKQQGLNPCYFFDY